MMRLRMLKQIGEQFCLGCQYDDGSQKHHMGAFGCLRDIEDKMADVSKTDLFDQSVTALHLSDEYDTNMIEQWRAAAVKDVEERIIESDRGYDENDWDDELLDIVPEVTPEVVGIVAQAMRFAHMWFYGINTYCLCPQMTETDFNNQIDDVLLKCKYRFRGYKVKIDLLAAVKTELCVKPKVPKMKDSEFGQFDN